MARADRAPLPDRSFQGVAVTARRAFGSIRKLPSGRYQARYFDAGAQRHLAPDTFATKADASRWLADVEVSLARGT